MTSGCCSLPGRCTGPPVITTAAGVLMMPETAQTRPGVLASLRPRVAVPRRARGTFARALPCVIAV
jgi:hypothetical protein